MIYPKYRLLVIQVVAMICLSTYCIDNIKVVAVVYRHNRHIHRYLMPLCIHHESIHHGYT